MPDDQQARTNSRGSSEVPRYKLLEPAYIDDKLLEADSEISFAGIPGYHMEPLNEAAHAMKKKHPSRYVDPIAALTDITAAREKDTMADTLAEALKRALAVAA